MSARARLAAYAVALGVAAGGGALLGAAAGPTPAEEPVAEHHVPDPTQHED